jgi:protein-tyrosine-phosphatase
VSETRTVLFLCPHHAAKSVIAAAYFDRLARARGLGWRADSAGTEPAARAAPAVVAALRAEGIDVAGHRPRHGAPEDLAAADRVISLGCDLGELASPGLRVEHWDDVPPASVDLDATRAALRPLRRRVETLAGELARETEAVG